MNAPEDARLKQAESRVGTTLRGKLRLDALIGVGGMAAVYTATHRNAKRVAVKMLHPELSQIEEARTRFVREGYAANRVEHPGAVSVLDDDVTEDGTVFLVMELLAGETLEARAARHGGKLDPAEVVAYADQILDVLAAAHERLIVHRDLKPENLFLTNEGQIKVLDFGLARLLEQAKDARLTASSAGIMGTPAFFPPEQVSASDPRLGRSADPAMRRADSDASGAPPRSRLALYLVGGVLAAAAAAGIVVSQSSRPAPTVAPLVTAVPQSETASAAPATLTPPPGVSVVPAVMPTASTIVSLPTAAKHPPAAPRSRASAAPAITGDPLLDRRH